YRTRAVCARLAARPAPVGRRTEDGQVHRQRVYAGGPASTGVRARCVPLSMPDDALPRAAQLHVYELARGAVRPSPFAAARRQVGSARAEPVAGGGGLPSALLGAGMQRPGVAALPGPGLVARARRIEAPGKRGQ